MSTDNIEHKLAQKEKPDTGIDLDIKQIEQANGASETAAETAQLEEPRPQFIDPNHPSFGQRLKAMLRSKKFWLLFVLSLLILIVAVWFIQPTRIWLLNAVGQRTKLEITVLTPAEGKQPAAQLKNATVVVNGRSFKTDQNGKVTVADQPYGNVMITATKRGYEEAHVERVYDFDPFFYRFGGKDADDAARNIQLSMRSVGVAVSFKAVDWLSGQPITTGEFIIGDIKAKADEQGVVAFKAPPEESGKVGVRSNFGGGFTDKSFDISLTEKTAPTITFVPAGKHYFLSKRSGAQSVYNTNLDGSEPSEIIPGTGRETDHTMFSVSPSGKYGVLASARDGAKNSQNMLLERLYVVDLEKKILTQVDEGVGLRFADWSGDRLVYVRNGVGTEGGEQAAVRSVDVTTGKASDIATGATSFGRIIVGFDQVIFAQNTSGKDGLAATQVLKRVDLKTGAARELGTTALTITQPDFDRVAFQTFPDQKWHEFNMNTGQLKDASRPPESASLVFLGTPSPDGTKRIVIDRVDGKFTLSTKTTTDGALKQLYAAGGLSGPIRFIGDTIVFRMTTTQETADYVVSLKGGEPKKITDVTATARQPGQTDTNLVLLY